MRSSSLSICLASSLWLVSQPVLAADPGNDTTCVTEGFLRQCLVFKTDSLELQKQVDVLLQERLTLYERAATLKSQIDVQGQGLRLCHEASDAQQKTIETLQNSTTAWYRNPLYMGVLGFVAGAATLTIALIASH